MSSSRIFKAGALALACASTASAAYQYTLAPEDNYSGPTFFDGFIFNTTDDANDGFVDYLGPGDALFDQLAYYDSASGTAYMGVDYWNAYSSTTSDTNRGRPSLRAQTIKTYQYGLFVVDLAHMPAGSCGTWPAFWTSSLAHWPEQGEIDIIENINSASYSEETLHTGPVVDGALCEVVGNVNTMSGQVGQQTGTQETYNCIWNATTSDYGSGFQYSGQGCSANNNNPNNFGTSFNANGGGVYAMEWTDEIIQIWNFGSGGTPVPNDLANGTPDPTGWGAPVFTTWGGNCDIAKHFIDHTVIFDIDFCGSWAGQQGIWESTTCYDAQYPTCNDYVAANPSSFSETYWSVKSLKVYQYTNVVVSSSSSSSTTSTSITSSSSTSSSTTTTSSTTSTSSTTATSTSSTAPATAVPTPVPTVGCYQEIGCWTEATNSRALTLATEVNYSIMTWEVCAQYCQLYGAVYFGVEYGGECYCGNEFEAGSVITSFSECDMPCDGNSEETCGGNDRLNVFKCDANLPPTSSSSSSSSSSTTSSTSSSTSQSSSSSVVSSSSSSSSYSSTSQSSSSSVVSSSSSSSSYSSTSSSSSVVSSSSTTYSATPSSSASVSPSSSNSPPASSLSSVSSSSSVQSTASGLPTTTTSSSYGSSSSSQTQSSSPSPYSNSSSATSTPSVSYTTSIVSTTTTRTISSCAPTVTNCPYGQVVTDTIELYTTVCPVTETQTSTPTSTAAPLPGGTTTLTISTTIVYTITSCAPTVTNCPAKLGQVTTETIELYTTVCPVSVAISLGLIPSPTGAAPLTPTPSATSLATGNIKASASTSTATTSLTVVKLVTATVQPVPSSLVSHTPVVNATVAGSTGIKGTSASTPSSSPIYKAGANGLQSESGMALVLVLVAALFL